MLLASAVIGLGKIGQEYDYFQSHKILTHANAFNQHEGYELIGGVDNNPDKIDQFEKKFACRGFLTAKQLFEEKSPEVVALAVPTQFHYEAFLETVSYQPKAIICEKPIAHDLSLAKQMIHAANEKNIIVVVNYVRRFEPGVQSLKKLIHEGIIGDIYKVIGFYSKGILNNGSHLIDLISFLLGEVFLVNILKKGREWQNIDPEPDVSLSVNDIDIYLFAGKEESYSIFDLEIYGTKGVIKYLNGGRFIQLHSVEKDVIYPGYKFLSEKGTNIPSECDKYQWHVLENLYQNFHDQTSIFSTGETAFKTLEIIDQIIKRLKEK